MLQQQSAVAKALRDVLQRMAWRLKPRQFCKLGQDLTFLVAGLRPVVMVDYLTQSPDLNEALGRLVSELCKAYHDIVPILRTMYLEDCIYVFNEAALLRHMHETLHSCPWLNFVLFEGVVPRMASENEKEELILLFRAVAALMTRLFSQSEQLLALNLGDLLDDGSVTIPALNGWLLGYPVIYFLRKDQVLDARWCFSLEDFHLYQVLANSGNSGLQRSTALDQLVEVLSFTVPCRLTLLEASEPWATFFMSHMQSQARGSGMNLQLEVKTRSLQSVAF